MIANIVKDEKLIELISQMNTQEEMVFIYKTIKSIPVSMVFKKSEHVLIEDIVNVLHDATFKNISKENFENYLSLVATKCEDTHMNSNALPQLIEDTKKSKASSYALDAIYAAMEVTYHRKNEKNCPINPMHVVSNIELALKCINIEKESQNTFNFIKNCEIIAKSILSSDKDITKTAKVIPFQKN